MRKVKVLRITEEVVELEVEDNATDEEIKDEASETMDGWGIVSELGGVEYEVLQPNDARAL